MTTTSPNVSTLWTLLATGYGPTRKTFKSAAREAAKWNESGDGAAHDGERITAEAVAHDGGFACEYRTEILEGYAVDAPVQRYVEVGTLVTFRPETPQYRANRGTVYVVAEGGGHDESGRPYVWLVNAEDVDLAPSRQRVRSGWVDALRLEPCGTCGGYDYLKTNRDVVGILRVLCEPCHANA